MTFISLVGALFVGYPVGDVHGRMDYWFFNRQMHTEMIVLTKFAHCPAMSRNANICRENYGHCPRFFPTSKVINMLWIFQTRFMKREELLTPYIYSNKNQGPPLNGNMSDLDLDGKRCVSQTMCLCNEILDGNENWYFLAQKNSLPVAARAYNLKRWRQFKSKTD